MTSSGMEATSGVLPRGARGIDRLDLLLALLAASLVVLTIVVVAEPTLSPVVLNARLDLVIEVIASLVAAGVAGLAWIRFRERPEPATIPPRSGRRSPARILRTSVTAKSSPR